MCQSGTVSSLAGSPAPVEILRHPQILRIWRHFGTPPDLFSAAVARRPPVGDDFSVVIPARSQLGTFSAVRIVPEARSARFGRRISRAI